MTLGTFLDSTARMYDRADVRGTIRRLPAQLTAAAKESARISVPRAYRTAEHVVVAGMGGSGLGAHVIQTACAAELRVPCTIVNDYALPDFVNRRTLVIASSYSGATEETLAAYRDARTRGAKLAVIATGGPLASLARRDGIPAYVFDPRENLSRAPRMAGGYLAMGTLGLLRNARLLHITGATVDRAIAPLATIIDHTERSAAILDLARALLTRIPILMGAEHLAGSLHTIQNQLHENAKHLAVSFLLPELNHHLLEGLQFPTGAPKLLHAIVCASEHYHPRTQRRITITREILRRQRIPSTVLSTTAPTRLGQALECIVYGAYLSLTLALLHRVDPAPNPWVDFLKTQLTKS